MGNKTGNKELEEMKGRLTRLANALVNYGASGKNEKSDNEFVKGFILGKSTAYESTAEWLRDEFDLTGRNNDNTKKGNSPGEVQADRVSVLS